MEEKIANIMKCLKCSREEAIDVIESDKAIDNGDRVYFDLSPKEEREAIKIANMNQDTKPHKPHKRTYKNDLKEEIIDRFFHFLLENNDNLFQNVQITNKSRAISFQNGDKKFEITLIQKRK